MEIRNQLTLKLITILQPPETILHLMGPLAYSPDGRSVACVSKTAIIIWDIPTGGVAKEIGCGANNISLVWSSNGESICTINSKDRETFTVHTYGVSSGTASSPGTLQSGVNPHLWTIDESFRVMTTVGGAYNIKTINIFKVGSTLTKIQSFSPRLSSTIYGMSFSPTTHRISLSDFNTLSISDVRSSEDLLCAEGEFFPQCFSSDGSLFAASQGDIVCVWKYNSGHYILCGKFELQGLDDYPSLQFSPTPSSSILGHSGNILQVLRLHELPTALETLHEQYVELSRSGTRVATAHEMESTVTTTDILAQTPPQIIDTGVAVEGLALTGNVILVAGSGHVVVWLLTGEGLVDGVIGDRRIGRGDSIWTIPSHSGWAIRVEGQIGVIKVERGDVDELQVYRTDTGEVLRPAQELRGFRGNWDRLHSLYCGRNHLRFHSLFQCNAPLKDRWQTSSATVREGWVKDAEGKHRLWIPAEWRRGWDPDDWRHDVTTQFSRLGGRPVIIKF